jgi:phosphopantetheine--protein transferase-like protein
VNEVGAEIEATLAEESCRVFRTDIKPISVRLHGTVPEVKIWFASLDRVFRMVDPAQVLPREEWAHALSFRRHPDRDRFLAGRTLLRYALTQTTEYRITPSSWRYQQGMHGKPSIGPNLPAVEFNLSHSHTCVAVGVSKSHPVGVDIEIIAPGDHGEIAADVLTERELKILESFDPPQRSREFIRLWTVKEACSKALGLGASIDFRELEIERDTPNALSACCLRDAGLKLQGKTSIICCRGHHYYLSLVEVMRKAP